MKFDVKKIPKSELEITITLDEKEMQTYVKQASEDISRDIKVKGFRPGNVPPHILEQYVDKKYLIGHSQDIAIKRSYAKVVIDEKLQVIARPKIEIKSEEPFTFVATVATMPDVDVKDYKSIKVAEKAVKVTDKDVDETINDMKQRFTEHKEVERAAKKGDRVELDFEGFDEKGNSVKNTKSTNHPVIIGENTLIPGFEDNLIGLKKGDEKEFDLTFPKDYHKKDFQNKKLKFKVKINVVAEPVTPELNEDLIQKITGESHNVDEFKKLVHENIQKNRETEAKQERENKYIEELLKKTKVEIPTSLIDQETEHIIEEVKENIEQRGATFEKFLEQTKSTMEDLKKKYRDEAEKRIKIRLALQYIIKEEDIKIEDKEVQAELDKVKSFYPEKEHSKIDQDFNKGNLQNQIINRLTLRKFFKKVL